MAKWTKQDRLIGIVSAVVALTGLVLFVFVVSAPVGFGWFAYTPLSGQVFTSGELVVLRRSAVIGAILFALGLVGIAFVLGTQRGAMRRRPGTDPLD